MPFIDIAFQAEVSRYEDPDFEEYARRNCNEDPRTRDHAIQELRHMVYGEREANVIRDAQTMLIYSDFCGVVALYLLLRTNLNKRRALDQHQKLYPMVRYEEFRRNNAYLYDCSAFGLQKVKNVYGGTLPESPGNGRITLMRFGKWDTDAVPIVDVVRCALIMDEIAVMQPKLQILGVTIIVDLDGLNVRQVSHLTPTIANQIVSLMGVSFPLLMHGLHIINYNWFLNSFFYIFKQFIPRAAWDRMHFHGYDMSSLHKHIDPAYLPPEYGGTCKHVISTEEWLRKVNMYKDDFMVQELRDLGFTVED